MLASAKGGAAEEWALRKPTLGRDRERAEEAIDGGRRVAVAALALAVAVRSRREDIVADRTLPVLP